MTIDTLTLLLLLGVALAQLLLLYRSLTAKKLLQQMELRLRESQQFEARGLFNQLESYHYLRDRLGLHEGLPYTRDWSAAPDFLKLIVEHALQRKPRVILECSSGLTSVMLARCCTMNGEGEVFSLENGAEFAQRTREELGRYRLQKATVIDAPLTPYHINDTSYDWYATANLPEQPIEMLVIDGPPGFIQKHSRYPALPLLFDRLADGCVIFMDDAARLDEQEIVKLWQEQFPGLEHRYVKTERGCSILSVKR